MKNTTNCANCGREIRFFHLNMSPKEAPAGFVECRRCETKESIDDHEERVE